MPPASGRTFAGRALLALLALTASGLALLAGGGETPSESASSIQPVSISPERPNLEKAAGVRTPPAVAQVARSASSSAESWLLSSAMGLVLASLGATGWALRKKQVSAALQLEGLSASSAFLLGCAAASWLA